MRTPGKQLKMRESNKKDQTKLALIKLEITIELGRMEAEDFRPRYFEALLTCTDKKIT